MVMLQSRPEPQSVFVGWFLAEVLTKKILATKKHDGISVTFFGVKMVFLRTNPPKKRHHFFSLKSWVLQGETSKTHLSKTRMD